MNNKQKTLKALSMLGLNEEHGTSKKYRVFRSGSIRYLVGKAGALRKTKTTIAGSISITDGKTHCALRELGTFPFMAAPEAGNVLRRIFAQMPARKAI